MKLCWVSAFVLALAAVAQGYDTLTVDITCDNTLYFYADGVPMVDESTTGYDNWLVTNTVQVPAATKVYAIKCLDHGVVAGILLSVSDGTVTDGTWRCTKSDPGGQGWLTDSYDDSGWSPAHSIHANAGSVPSWGVRPGISSEAEWIWTTGWHGEDKTVYCRKEIKEHIDVDITCDNKLWFYADGVAIIDSSTTDYDNWRVTKHVEVPADTMVYGIKCVDLHVVAGILASFNDGTVTDSSWRCTDSAPGSLWLNEAFDDSSWQTATSIFINNGNVPRWGIQHDISSDASWIWTDGWNGEDRTVWCRKFVEPQCSANIEGWYGEGCVWDRMESCKPIDTALNCGWGYKRHFYYCGPNDERHCSYRCYKPCGGSTVPLCSSLDTASCSITWTSPCSSKCGVGDTILKWTCPGDKTLTCSDQCCCERCTGSGGPPPANVCNAENMALALSNYAAMCPQYHFSGKIP